MSEPLVLVVQHQDDCPPALFEGWLTQAGVALDVRRPYVGDDLPADLGDHQGLLVLGGSPGANDDEVCPWFPRTRELFRTAAREDVPALGICLGHQLAAVAFGGRIGPNPAGKQVGVLEMGWAEDVDGIFGSRPGATIHWNDDVVLEVPGGAEVLARATGGEVQALRLAPRVWGVQPHPEVDEAIIGRWAAGDRASLGDALVDGVLAEIVDRRTELQTDWRAVAEAFAAEVFAAS